MRFTIARIMVDKLLHRLGYVRRSTALKAAERAMLIGLLAGRHHTLTGVFDLEPFLAYFERDNNGGEPLH